MEADPYTDDYTDEISELVEEAHAIFNATFMSLSVPIVTFRSLKRFM